MKLVKIAQENREQLLGRKILAVLAEAKEEEIISQQEYIALRTSFGSAVQSILSRFADLNRSKW